MGTETPQRPQKEAAGSRHEPTGFRNVTSPCTWCPGTGLAYRCVCTARRPTRLGQRFRPWRRRRRETPAFEIVMP